MWDVIWKAKVPEKIKFFAWKAATNSLAVQVNRVAHHQIVSRLCTICGVQDTNIFHALVTFPKARALCIALGDVWNIPGEELFKFTEPYWLLILLDQLGSPVCEKGMGRILVRKNVRAVWRSTDPEYIKINVDASFVESMRSASVGVLSRNHLGEVLVSSWDFIQVCFGAEEEELPACLAGLYIDITLHRPIILETNCFFAASFLAKETVDKSPYVDLKKEAMSASKFIKELKVVMIDRHANKVTHEIAKFSFDSRSDGVLCNCVPPCMANYVMNDCKTLVISSIYGKFLKRCVKCVLLFLGRLMTQ
ncbi:hypothetical protein ZWY2020_033941 [Hordeum vulgare]|nr:hypothetical protein ZWY2020_033941 [Hordeum vulgare]